MCAYFVLVCNDIIMNGCPLFLCVKHSIVHVRATIHIPCIYHTYTIHIPCICMVFTGVLLCFSWLLLLITLLLQLSIKDGVLVVPDEKVDAVSQQGTVTEYT